MPFQLCNYFMNAHPFGDTGAGLPPAYAFAPQFEGWLEFDTLGRLGQIAAPTLVTVGKQDLLPPVELSQEIAAGILNAELIMLEHRTTMFGRA